ncbi:MAG: carbon-nitrogen family hydrolase [Clostridia bacterium]|nr:carbon-nitrogen family hydrolase [Clostridia bacterium]
MKIAVIQMNMKAGDTAYNYYHAEELLLQASQASPDLIILPETWNTGFFPKDGIEKYADKNGENAKKLLSRISKGNTVSIIGGSVTEEKNGKIYNTSYIYNEKGENIYSYSKMHLFSPMDEHIYFTPGDRADVFSLCGVNTAVLICYDLRFPEAARALAVKGAEILFVVSQWPCERIAQMEILLKARAVENQMFTVLCNSCGKFGETVYGGNSMVCDPLGNVIKSAKTQEEILFCDINLKKLTDIRSSINVFRDRRTDIY